MNECCGIFIAEHRQTERLLADLRARLETTAWPAAEAAYALLRKDLLRHFALEEQTLFAALNPYRTMMLMEAEHDLLLGLEASFAEALQKSITAQRADETLMPHFEAFNTHLMHHMAEEEDKIFPMAERLLEAEEKARLRRIYMERLEAFTLTEPLLLRPEPTFVLGQTDFTRPPEKPLTYETLYDREHTSAQHVRMLAGTRQAPHWAGQHQCLIVLGGTVDFESQGQSHRLEPGGIVQLDSHLTFALAAVTDAQLIALRVWPQGHFSKG